MTDRDCMSGTEEITVEISQLEASETGGDHVLSPPRVGLVWTFT